jgi:hypothetical protein
MNGMYVTNVMYDAISSVLQKSYDADSSFSMLNNGLELEVFLNSAIIYY